VGGLWRALAKLALMGKAGRLAYSSGKLGRFAYRAEFLVAWALTPVRTGTRNMKIAVDLTPMRPGGENGGIKLAAMELLKGLQAQLGDQLQFLLLTADDTLDEATALLRERDKAFCVFRRIGKGNLAQVLELGARSKAQVRRLLQDHRPDVLYCPFGALLFPSEEVPTVVTVVDTLHRDFPFSLPVQAREWRELQFRKLLATADFFQVISEFTAERLKSLYHVSPEQIFVTHLPIHARLTPVAVERQPFFFYPANLWVHKNHEVLLIAYQFYLAKCADQQKWELVLTGHLDERFRVLQALADDLGISAHLKFLGHVSEQDLARLYSSASCLVFPSLHEGFGIPIVEAMSFGLPIICGRETSIPEIAGPAAFYADIRNPQKLGEALFVVAENEGLRNELVALGRERLKRFDFALEVKRLSDQLVAVAGKKPRLIRRRFDLDVIYLTISYHARSLARKALKAATEIPTRLENFCGMLL
jgi:glycosyltransferase involved in cell wall biosynthesis